MNSPTEFDVLARQVIELLAGSEQDILMDYQNSLCGGCTGPKFVYKSPTAYKIAQLLSVIKKRGYLHAETGN